ncbi:MAG: CopG family transcriptional regulator [Treponema sp.]|jgi:predicted DNA-binding protein|nr:CopG family transcriptional regulator [Treponema sp.]
MNALANAQITTARLPLDTRNKLLVLSKIKNKTKSDIIKESLDMYYEYAESEIDSFSVGESYFGKYGSGESDRATAYKERIKEKLADRQGLQESPKLQGKPGLLERPC